MGFLHHQLYQCLQEFQRLTGQEQVKEHGEVEEQDIRTELSSDQGFVYKQNEYGLNFVLQYKVHRKREV